MYRRVAVGVRTSTYAYVCESDVSISDGCTARPRASHAPNAGLYAISRELFRVSRRVRVGTEGPAVVGLTRLFCGVLYMYISSRGLYHAWGVKLS